MIMGELLLCFFLLFTHPSFGQLPDERLSFLENKIAQISSRVLSLEYAFKDFKAAQGQNKLKITSQDYEVPTISVSTSTPSPPSPTTDNGDLRPRDCSEIMEELDHIQRVSDFYTIYPISRNRPLEVFCDMSTYGGGWTVLQRRGFEGEEREDFNRTWKEYSKGFGKLDADYWLGLENMVALTKYDDQEVLYEFLQKVNGRKITSYLNYDRFQIENAENLYRLHIEGFKEKYSTNLSYYLEKQDGMPFTTRDKDNAGTNNRNCRHNSGWWLQPIVCHRQPDLNMPFDNNGVLQLQKFSVVQPRDGVSIKIRARKPLANK